MININENLNIYGAITEKATVDGKEVDKPVIALNTSFSNNNTSFTLSFNVLDAALLTANKTDVQAQMDVFMQNIKTKMQELGYVVTI